MDLLVDLANLIEDSNQIAKCQECSRRKNEQQNVCNLCIPKSEPAPINSRTQPRRVSASANPKPIPRPSNALAIGVFLQANDSARPRMIQFTTISGM